MTKQQQIEALQAELEHRQEIENQAILLLNTFDDEKLRIIETE